MDVALTTDRRSIPQARGHTLNRSPNVFLDLRLRIEGLEFLQRQRREHGACPGAEIFCGDIAAGDFAQVGVDVGRVHVPALAILVEILEQVLPRQILARLDNLGDAPVLNLEAPRLATLALELETQLSSVDFDVRVAQSCETVAFVLLGIVVVADWISVVSRRCTTVASTFSRGRPRSIICSAILARSFGSDRANSIMCSYFELSRTARNCGW